MRFGDNISGKENFLNLIDDDDSITPFKLDTIPNYPAGHQLPDQANKNLWIVDIYWEEPIMVKGSPDYLKHHQPNKVKSNVKISICKIKYFNTPT